MSLTEPKPVPARETLLELRDVTRSFAVKSGLFGPTRLLQAVRGVSLELARGDVLALVGESGCGKTTLARLLMGVLPATSGEILYRGQPMAAQSLADDDRQDILVYRTAPLDRPLRVIGPVSVTLWIGSDAPDTDFTAKLIDQRPDGSAVNVTYGIVRCRYRDGYGTEATALIPGQAYCIEIVLNPTAIVFGAGHCIRLDISSSDFPNFDRNHNTGRDFWSDPEMRSARQVVFHDRDHPSRLVLPVIAD